MDSSTQTFIAVLVGLFLISLYLNKPNSNDERASSSSKSKSRNAKRAKSYSKTPRQPRVVTKDMIEIVQQFNPMLTEEQIVYDIQRSGSMEATINNLEKNGDLPQPPVSKRSKKQGWADTKDERASNLKRAQEELVMKARMRLKAELANEINF